MRPVRPTVRHNCVPKRNGASIAADPTLTGVWTSPKQDALRLASTPQTEARGYVARRSRRCRTIRAQGADREDRIPLPSGKSATAISVQCLKWLWKHTPFPFPRHRPSLAVIRWPDLLQLHRSRCSRQCRQPTFLLSTARCLTIASISSGFALSPSAGDGSAAIRFRDR